MSIFNYILFSLEHTDYNVILRILCINRLADYYIIIIIICKKVIQEIVAGCCTFVSLCSS